MNNPKPNHDPETNLAFGVISAQVLDADLVDRLIYGGHITNHSYELAKCDWLLKARALAMYNGHEFDQNAAEEEFNDGYQRDNDYITGTVDGVSYATSWFSGSLSFFIMKSPYTKGTQLCSPCAPGAGDLHTEGTLLAYDVPPAWRA